MTTSNQIALRKVKEEERANRKKEEFEGRKTREMEKQGKFGRITSIMKGISNLAIPSGHNDEEWYMMDKSLAENAANLSYVPTLGLETPTEFDSNVMPGICKINFMPTIGSSGENLENNVSNIAAKNIYAYVRHANSGGRNYEASDLLMYIYAVDQLISYHAYLTRLYSVVTHVDSHNRYTISALCNALGADYNDLSKHMPDLLFYINKLAVNINSLYIPKTLPLLQRHSWLNSSLFKDSELKKSQIYAFVQAKFGVYDDTTGVVRFTPVSGTQFIPNFAQTNPKYTFEQLSSFGDYMLGQLINSEDIGIMSGDILKAYGEGNLVYVSNISSDYDCGIEYHEGVLNQIHNSILTNASYTSDQFDIKQTDKGMIYQGLPMYNKSNDLNVIIGYGIPCNIGYTYLSDTVDYPVDDLFKYTILNMYKDNPSVGDNLISTRLIVSGVFKDITFNAPGSASRPFSGALTVYGSEIVIDAVVYILNSEATNGLEITKYTRLNIVDDTNFPIIATLRMAQASRFNSFPRFAVVMAQSDVSQRGDYFNYRTTIFDSANYTSVSKDTLSRMHQVAVLSELGVPKLGLSVRTR